MKRAISTFAIIGCSTFFLIGADFLPAKKEVKLRKHCSGYTIVEAGKGIDCYGDTVKLVKHNGFYELASLQKQ